MNTRMIQITPLPINLVSMHDFPFTLRQEISYWPYFSYLHGPMWEPTYIGLLCLLFRLALARSIQSLVPQSLAVFSLPIFEVPSFSIAVTV